MMIEVEVILKLACTFHFLFEFNQCSKVTKENVFRVSNFVEALHTSCLTCSHPIVPGAIQPRKQQGK